MELWLLWTVRAAAMLLWMSHGGYLAITAKSWREDSAATGNTDLFDEPPTAEGRRGCGAGLFWPFASFALTLSRRAAIHGTVRTLVPFVALGLTLVGWPVSPEWWQGVDWLKVIFVIPMMILFEEFIWISIGTFFTGYIFGRLAHRSFFGERM